MGEIHKSIRDIHQIGKRTVEFLISSKQCVALDRYAIRLAGISLATPQFQFARNNSPIRQILVCFRGVGEVWVQGRWRRCTSGMAYVTPAGHFHAYHAKGTKPWEIGWVTYEPQEKDSRQLWQTIHEPRLMEVDPRPWEHILQGFYHETSQFRETGLLEYWAALLQAQVCRTIMPHPRARLWRLWGHVQCNLSYPWNLTELAKQAGLEKEHLRRICHRESGRSPMQHVIYLRMQHAISLLASGLKVSAVAEAVGYTNGFAFSTAFKRTLGQEPSKFRNRFASL